MNVKINCNNLKSNTVEPWDILVTKGGFVYIVVREDGQLFGEGMDGINWIDNPQSYVDNKNATLYKKGEWELILQQKE